MDDLKTGIKGVAKTGLAMMGNAGLDILLTTGASFVIKGISDWINRDQIAIEKGQEAQSTIKSTFDEFSNGKTTLNTLGQSFNKTEDQITNTGDAITSVAEKYTELAKGVNSKTNANMTLSDEDYQTYLNISSQLASLYPQLQSGIDSQGNAMLNLGTNAKSAAKDIQNLYNQQMTSSNVKIGAELQTQLEGVQTQVSKYQALVDEYDSQKKSAENKKTDVEKLSNFSIDDAFDASNMDIEVDEAKLGKSASAVSSKIQELLQKNGILYDTTQVLDMNAKPGEEKNKTVYTLMNATEDQIENFKTDMSSVSGDLSKQFAVEATEAEKKSASTTALIQDQWKSMSDSLGQYLQTTDSFDKLDTGIQNALLKNMGNIDISKLSKEYDGDALQMMYDQFITPLSDLSKDSQKALADVFDIDQAETTASDYANKVNAALEKAFPNDKDLQQKWKDNFGLTSILEENQRQLDEIKAAPGLQDAASQIENLTGEDRQIAYDLVAEDNFSGTFEQLQAEIEKTKNTVSGDNLLSGLQGNVKDIQTQYSNISSAISESMSDTGLTADSITTLKDGLQSIIDSSDELKDYDLNALFTNTSKGVKLDNDRLEDLLDIQHQIKEKDFAESIQKQNDAIDEQSKALETVKKGTDEYTEAQDNLKTAQEQLAEMQQAQSQYYAQYQQQKQLFSDYAEWQRATQTENSGDKYLSMVSGLDTAKKAWDAGEIGTDDFKSFAKMISPSGATDPVNFAENYAKAARYLTSDESGLVHFFEDLSTKTDAAGQAMASFNEETQSWELNTHDLGEVAQKLGTGTPVVEALFGRAEDYGATTTVISDMQDGILKATEATKNWSEAKARLDQMNEENAQAQKEGKDPIYNTTAIKAAEDEVANYQKQIDGLQESMDYYAEHNLGSEAQQKKIKTAADEIKNIQEQVQAAENANNKALADSYRNMAKEKAAAAGITVDDNLNVTGDGKTAQEQLKEKSSSTSSTLSGIDFDYDKTTMSLDQIDSKIKELQDSKVNVDVAVDGEDAVNTLDTEISSLEAQKVQVQIQTAVENGNSFQKLLTLSDQKLMTTVGCDASQVDQVRDEIREMSGEQVDLTVAMDSIQFGALINAITGEEIEIPVEANTDGVEAETKSAVEGTDAKVTPSVDTSQVESETQSAVQNAAEGTKPSVEVTGNVTTLTAGTGLTPVAVTGNVVQLTGTPSQPVDVNANATTVTGTPSGTVDVNANATTISGEPSGTVDVKGNVTSVTGTPSGTVNVKGNITAGKVEKANGTTSSGTINYKKGEVEKADGTKSTGTIDYKKGNVEKADGTVSTGVINYDLGTVATPKSATATGVINYTLGTVAKPKASGTMYSPASSPARASGTVYNVINYGSAYANGKVGLQRSENALVNEIGQESIIRGDRWLMLPPGMHTQSLKKGDIVLNAQQTADLLAHGKANGTARAYAHGSLSDIAPAHANSPGVGAATLKFQGGLASSKYGNTKSSGNSNSANASNTNATKANTNATKANTKSTKKSTSAFDFVARALSAFANRTKAIADTINDYVTSAFKTSQLSKQMSAINAEIKANTKGAAAYLAKANSVGLNRTQRDAVINGRYRITDYNTESKNDGSKTEYDKLQEYAKYYDEYVKCTQAVQDLKNQQLELFEQWANMPTEAAEKKIEKLKAGFNGLTAIQARLKTASLGGSAQAYLNNELKSSVNSTKKTRDNAKGNLNNANKRLSSANKSYSTARRTESVARKTARNDRRTVRSAVRNLKNNSSLSQNEQVRISSGRAISTRGLSGKKKTLVQRYNAALAKSYASNRNVTRAQNNTKKAASKVTSARKTVSTARATYNTANSLYQSYAKQYSTASKYLNSGNTLGYQNYLTDMEFNNTKQQNKTNQDAYAQAKKNTQNMEKQKASAKNTVNKIVNRNKATGTRIVNKYSRKLSQSQINALKAGKTVSTRGTSGTLKRQLEAYNKALANSASALRQARDKYYDISTKVDIARKAEEEAAATAAESQAETAQAAIEAEKTKFENVSNYYDKRMDYEKALAEKEEEARNFDDAHGDYTKSSDYNTEISSQKKQRDLAQQKVDALKKQLASALSSGKIKKGSEEWLEMSTTITEAESAVKDLDTTIENTKQKQLTTKYEEMFDRAIAKAEQLISKIDTINDLLTEEMMYDYDTGQLTDMGALSLTLNAQSMNDSLDTLQNYVKKRQQIIDDYNNKLFGEQKYDELMSENDSNIQNALKNANSYKQQILSIVKTQSQKEQDALFKVIDARKEALKKKKEYYDYDKQLKSKTKEINLLQQQIDALDGVTDAESRAQKARLEAQLKDAQDDLDDTVRDHVYDLQVDGLDDLEDQLKEDFEKWSNELSGNLDKMSKAINDAINNSGASAADAMNTLAEVLKQFNITPDQLGISASNLSAGNIKKYAKGTDHVGHNSVCLTNENGREIVVTNKGWLTKLGASDQIISTDNTAALIEMAEKYRNNDLISNIKIPEIKSDGGKSVTINYGGNTFTVQGDLVRDTLPDLQTILKKSNEYTQNKMRQNLRRFG